MNIVFVGPPASGKGTITRRIQKKNNLPILSTGDMCRNEMQSGSERGKLIASYIDAGNLAPDEIILDMVCSKIQELPDGCMLDGFPRNLSQAQAFEKLMAERGIRLDGVVYFNASDDVIINRVSKRTVCSKCQKPYHSETIIPKIPGVCDDCGGEIVHRPDDNPEALRKRLEIYRAETEPIIGFYRSMGLLYEVDAALSIDEQVARTELAMMSIEVLGGKMCFEEEFETRLTSCSGCYHRCGTYNGGRTFRINSNGVAPGYLWLTAGQFAPCGKRLTLNQIEQRMVINVRTPKGMLRAYECADPDYPGIGIDLGCESVSLTEYADGRIRTAAWRRGSEDYVSSTAFSD